MKRNTRTRTVIALVFLMILAFVAVSACADTTYTPINGMSVSLVQNLVVNSDANIPAVAFTYSIVSAMPKPATDKTLAILAGDGFPPVGSAVFSYSDTASTIPGTSCGPWFALP